MSVILKRNRIQYLDIAKGIAMLSVVIGHTVSPLRNFVYLYHLPVFFFVSGYLWHPKETYRAHVVSRLKALYLPFVATGLMYCVASNLLYHLGCVDHVMTSKDLLKQLLRVVFFGGTSQSPIFGPMWFLRSLFLIDLIYFILDRAIGGMLKLAIATYCLTLVGWVIKGDSGFIDTFLVIPLLALPLFFIGGVFRWYSLKISTAMVLVGFGLLVAGMFVLRIDLSRLQVGHAFIYYPVSIIGVVVVIGSSEKLYNAMPRISSIFSFIGRHTIVILALHMFSMAALIQLLHHAGIDAGNVPNGIFGRSNWWIPLTIWGVVMPLMLAMGYRKAKDALKGFFAKPAR